jgi:hypothetical protein
MQVCFEMFHLHIIHQKETWLQLYQKNKNCLRALRSRWPFASALPLPLAAVGHVGSTHGSRQAARSKLPGGMT